MRVNVTREQISKVFDDVKHDPSFNESREVVQRGGLPVEMIQAMSLRPEILRGFAGFGQSVYPGGLLERKVKELVIIESSRANACQFCTESHLALVHMLGLMPEPMKLLDDTSSLSEREQLAVEYTRAAMADSNRVPDRLFDRLRAQYSDAEIVELTFLVGYINMLNLFNNCLQVRYHGEYAKSAASG